MDTIKIEAEADYLSMGLVTKVINRQMNITEAMYSIANAMSFLLVRTLPRDAFEEQTEKAQPLAKDIVEVINTYIKQEGATNPARVALALNMVLELIMDTTQQNENSTKP